MSDFRPGIDLHLTDDDWGVSTYPLVPGHEIAGTAIPAGDQATGLRIRQRVGVSAAASPGELRVPMFGLVEGQKSAGGSAVGSNAETRKRLEVPERIDSPIEIYKTPEVNEVQSRLRRNEIRYRAVLTPDRNTWSRG